MRNNPGPVVSDLPVGSTVDSSPALVPPRRNERRVPLRTLCLGIVAMLLLHASVLGALAWADLQVRRWVEVTAEQQVAHHLPQAEHVDVTLDGFPFTLDLLLDQRVEGVHVTVDLVEQHGIAATDLRLDVEELVLDGDALIDDRRLELASVKWARIEGYLPAEEIAEIVGHPIEIEDHALWATVGTERVRLEPRIHGPWLELHVDGSEVGPMLFPLPTRGDPPCRPIVAPLGDRLRLSCTVDHLPETIRLALAG